MSAVELLISESQERMLAFVDPEKVADVLAVSEKWEISASVIGTVVEGDLLSVTHRGELVAEVRAASLSEEAPVYDRPSGEPGWQEDLWANTVKMVAQPAIATSLMQLLDDPSLASKAWVYEQYDHMLFLNTVIGPGHDATLLRLRDTDKGLAVSTDGNGRLCYLDPRRGSARLVYETALNLAMVGALPLALVDNLNFGNPEKPEVMWQFKETVEGLAEACQSLGVPVVGGNVSFYNETDEIDIYPTPVIGMLGLVEPLPASPPRLDGAREGMEVWLFGPEWAINLAGSSFEQITLGHLGGRPSAADPSMARAANETAVALVSEGLARVLHDVSDGGLALALAEVCIISGVGATIAYSDWRHLFCEDSHRFLAAVASEHGEEVVRLAERVGIPAARIGRFGGDAITFDRGGIRASIDLALATETWRNAIPRRMR
jgi:phosphoribosylformylglycinamidine synthase